MPTAGSECPAGSFCYGVSLCGVGASGAVAVVVSMKKPPNNALASSEVVDHSTTGEHGVYHPKNYRPLRRHHTITGRSSELAHGSRHGPDPRLLRVPPANDWLSIAHGPMWGRFWVRLP